MDKELKQLEERIKKLEKSSSSLFGSSYSTVGSSSSDFLIKTRGKVKIQWGNKFIDLLKNGAINVDAKFIFKQEEVGSKDGIYVVGDDIILSVDSELIPLKESLPTGSIIMFNGEASEIPEGWAICDGNNNTPNLIGKFIKAADVAGTTGNLNMAPDSGISDSYYSLIYIMKL